MADLLALSSRIIDSGVADEPVNRITQELSEVADGVAVIESFSHVIAFRTAEGLVVFDASGPGTGAAVVEALRSWVHDEVHSIVYTHGHVDHVGGSPAFVADADRHGYYRPLFVGQERVRDRFDRYRMTDGWNLIINSRQFGWLGSSALRMVADESGEGSERHFLPGAVAQPDITYRDRHMLSVGGVDFELRHGQGETDDHTWAWIPSRRAICCGDFLIWNFPNAGNPQKVQRYPREWAASLRQMAALEPELLLPAHGLPVAGRERIARVLHTVAGVLDDLVDRTVAMMNDGATLDVIVQSVKVSEDTLAIPYLRPLYDEPEFVVRNVWRLYGGWWDANPARLKPASDGALALEVAALAGGTGMLVTRARELASGGDLRMASQLVEWAAQAEPDSRSIHEARAEIYEARKAAESSLMAKGIFAGAAAESERVLANVAEIRPADRPGEPPEP
jgi:alkyl sulfatase BDS1-like metallo-beta-lactamase superfamily hydrolase